MIILLKKHKWNQSISNIKGLLKYLMKKHFIIKQYYSVLLIMWLLQGWYGCWHTNWAAMETLKKKNVLLSISTATTAREKNEVFVIPDIKMIWLIYFCDTWLNICSIVYIHIIFTDDCVMLKIVCGSFGFITFACWTESLFLDGWSY